jgi:hypothetical protein
MISSFVTSIGTVGLGGAGAFNSYLV